MYKIICILPIFLLILSGCDESGEFQNKNDVQKQSAQRIIEVKNSVKKSVKKSLKLSVKVEAGDTLFANSKIVDNFESSKVANIELDLEGADGTKVIKLELEDRDGNMAKPLSLKVIKDTTPPVIKLTGDEQMEIVLGSHFKDPGVVAKDNIDKDLNITVNGVVDSSSTGSYKIRYSALDDAGNMAEIFRTVAVEAVKNYNFAPQFIAKSKELHYEDAQDVTINLHSFFSDRNDKDLNYTAIDLPENLTLTKDGFIKGVLSKDASSRSPYKLEIQASDSKGKSVKSRLSLMVKNPAPLAANDKVKLYSGKSVLIDVLKNDSDADKDLLTISAVNNPLHGKAVIKGDKIFYTPDINYTGTDSFSYVIKDSDGASAAGTVNITVKEFKNIPIVYLSQDTWDRDNYSLIAAAKKMHQRELIELRGVDVTGKDVDGKVSNVFRAILGDDTDIPVLINHSFYGRVTPTTRRFPELAKFVATVIADSDSLDSTDYILSDLENLDSEQKVVYVAGGHLHNFASLLLRDTNLVNEKVDKIVISSGWEDRYNGKPETNLSEGVYRETTTSKATQIVFSKFKGEIVMASDPDARYPTLDTSKMDRSSALWYFIVHGKYNDQQLHIGDFEALLYGAVEDSWYGKHWVDRKDAKCSVTNYGAIKLSGSGVACSYLDNMNSYYTKAVLEELLYRED